MANFTNFDAILALSGGGGTQDLGSVLGFGNSTGGSDIEFQASTGDGIRTEDNTGGAGYALDIDGSDAGGVGDFAGGDINLNPGTGVGSGADGVVNVNGDLVVTGSVTLSNLTSGTGSPETAVTAGIGTIYTRTDGSAGNAMYIKQFGAGNTGWVPAGPMVIEEFAADGVSADFTTGRAVFDSATSPVSGISGLEVYWNGTLQREGGSEDYTVVYGGASATVTFNITPPLSDLITIKYLPE